MATPNQIIKYAMTDSSMDVTVIAASGRMARSFKSRRLTLRPSPTIAAVSNHVVNVRRLPLRCLRQGWSDRIRSFLEYLE